MRPSRVASALAVAFSVVCGVVGAGLREARANFAYASFPNSTGLTLVNNAAVNTTAAQLRVTPATANQYGAAWYTTQQNVGAGFTSTFTFSITNQNAGGGDGFAFVIQNSAVNAVGLHTGGCQLGYDGMPNSVAVEFDTYTSGTCEAGNVGDTSDNHVSVHTLGVNNNSAMESASIGSSQLTAAPAVNMSDGAVHTVKIEYFPGTLNVYVDDMTTPRISAPLVLATTLSLNAGKAWVGFTGATGGANERHNINSWSLTEGAPAGSGRPRTPTITEPTYDGRIVNPQDVHMETGTFFSPNNYGHLCSDWEIWTVTPSERVWHADCKVGVERLHIHLADGVFSGSYALRRDLVPSTNYVLKARHRDTSGIAATEYSFYAQRSFSSGALGSNLPMIVDDVKGTFAWLTDAGLPVVLPAGATPPSMTLGAADGSVLLTIAGLDGTQNAVNNPGPLETHVQVRVAVSGGSSGVTLPKSSIQFLDDDCDSRTIYLPAMTVGAGGQSLFWVSGAGSTYAALATDDHANLVTLSRGTDSPFLSIQAGYVVEKFTSGLTLPVNIAFVPNPGPNPTDIFFYVTELYGNIKVVTRNGAISNYRTGLLTFPATGAFPGSGEQGLTGIVVDPTNGDLFCTRVIDDGSGTGTHAPEVIRIQSADGGRTGLTPTRILYMPNDPQGQSHQISNISFGPDGFLYVHMGDGFVASAGQDLTLYRGKILRMTRSGQPATTADPNTTNPFYNAADGITARDYVYAYGVRNPFGGAWRLSDNMHITVENGPTVDRIHKLVRGQNYLYDGSDTSMHNFAIYNWEIAHGPVNIAFTQTGVFGGSGFPADKMDHVFVSESGPTWGEGPQELGKRISEFVINSAGVLQSGPTTLVEYAGSGRGSVVGLAAGPDGLYFSTLYKDLDYAGPTDVGASIFRVRYVGAVSCCSADFNGDGDVGTDADIEAFFACLGGECCPTCGGADYNNDGDVGTDADIEAFFRVLGGGVC